MPAAITKSPCPVPGCGGFFAPQGMTPHLKAHEREANGEPRKLAAHNGDGNGEVSDYALRRNLAAYLKAVKAGRTRSKPVDVDALEERILKADKKGQVLRELALIEQKRRAGNPAAQLEEWFISYGKVYAERKGISAQAFMEFGVPAPIVKAAKIPTDPAGEPDDE